MQNSGDNVLGSSGDESLVGRFLDEQDYSPHTRRAFVSDLNKFSRWFREANRESFKVARVTTGDITAFRDALRREQGLSVPTVNRSLVALRSFFNWLVEGDYIAANPTKKVKELRRQQLSPKGLERSQVRKLLREVELRGDHRANAIFHVLLFTGCRVGDLVHLQLPDLTIGDRSGTITFRNGKANKERTVPLPLLARQAVKSYFTARPESESKVLFCGQRGPLTDRGVRDLCDRYSEICGFKLHPHLLRHTMAKKFLEDSGNDLVSLAQILGHESLNTTARYTKRGEDQLAAAADKMTY
ncbi:MAG: tyrosine-type recombinase/integrase [Planctomycetota bacterium]|nr:tyrosine-type recombinase/integrase [Planctomycetota bacterium]